MRVRVSVLLGWPIRLLARPALLLTLTSAAVGSVTDRAWAQATPEVVTDLAVDPAWPLKSAINFVPIAGRTVFQTSEELWETDGTADGTRPLYPAPIYWAEHTGIADAGDAVIFSAVDPALGNEVWAFDGARAEVLADVVPGWGSSLPVHFVRVGDAIFFIAVENHGGGPLPHLTERGALFRIPIRDGPLTVERIEIGAGPDRPDDVLALSPAPAGAGRPGVWVVARQERRWATSYVSAAGAVERYLLPGDIAGWIGTAQFFADDRDLWLGFSDNSTTSVKVFDLIAGAPPAPLWRVDLADPPQQIVRAGDELLAVSIDASGGSAVWAIRPDGVEALRAYPPPGAAWLATTDGGDTVLLGAGVPTVSRYAGGELVDMPGTEVLSAYSVARDDQGLVLSGFHRRDRSHVVLRPGQPPLHNSPGASGSAPYLRTVEGQTMFVDPNRGGLYVVGATTAVRLSSLNRRRTADLRPFKPLTVGRSVFAIGNIEGNHRVVWADGQQGQAMNDFQGLIGRAGGRAIAWRPTVYPEIEIFSIDQAGEQTVLEQLRGPIRGASITNGRRLYMATTNQLFSTDGMSVERHDAPSGRLVGPLADGMIVESNQEMFLVRGPDEPPSTLGPRRGGYHFVSLGVHAITADFDGLRVVDPDGTVETLSPERRWARDTYLERRFAVQVGNRAFVTYYDGIIVTDGTAAGTRAIFVGDPDEDLVGAAEVNGGIVFSVLDPTHGRELWFSDGTPEGTGLLADVYPGPGSSDPEGFANVDGHVLFTANTKDQGREIFVTDGTAEGTRLLFDAVPGPFGSDPAWFRVADELIYFSGDHPEFGREIWAFSRAAVPPPSDPDPDPDPDLDLDPNPTPGSLATGESGCGCRTAPAPAQRPRPTTAGWALLLIATLWRRRRCSGA